MKQNQIFSILKAVVFIMAFTFDFAVVAQNSKFTVVLDAGHGGHDPGAIGKISREKDINLAVALQLGEIIASNYSDVKVVYTRSTDKFIPLQERANIANNNHADLFLSIHTNSAKSSSAYGTEVFTLGLAKTKGNLDVAMRENAVMLLEDDYKSNYKGFDPSSVDSYIMFEFMQDKYIDRSISFASEIQNQFKNYAGRSDRGVRQAGFWVLYQSACPSVLVEVGFISNPAEEKFLSSATGQKQLAQSIFKAFISFKHEYDKKSGKTTKKSFIETESIKIDEVGRSDKRVDGVTAPLNSAVANTKDAVVPISEIEKPPIQNEVSKKPKSKGNDILKSDRAKTAEMQPVDPAKAPENIALAARKDKMRNDKLAYIKNRKDKNVLLNENNSENDIKSTEKLGKDTDIIADTFGENKQNGVKSKSEKVNESAPKEINKSNESTSDDTQILKKSTSESADSHSVKTTPIIQNTKPISAEKQQYVDMRAYKAATQRPLYKVQLFARSKKLNTNAAEFRGIRNTDFYIENGMYKYTIGADSKYEIISKLRNEMLSIFPEAFVVAFLGKSRITINEALKLSKKNK